MAEEEIRVAFPTDEGEVYMTPTQFAKWEAERAKETPAQKEARLAEKKALGEKIRQMMEAEDRQRKEKASSLELGMPEGSGTEGKTCSAAPRSLPDCQAVEESQSAGCFPPVGQRKRSCELKQKIDFRRVVWPSIVLFVVYFVSGWIKGGSTFEPAVQLVACILMDIMAFLTCGIFVLRKNRASYHVWINYAVWMFISVEPTVAALLK